MKQVIFVTTVISFFIVLPGTLTAGYFDSGCRYYMYRNYEKAREMFQKDVETRNHGDGYYFLGEIEKKEGDLEKSAEYFAKALDRPMSKKYRKLAYWNIIVLLEEKRDYNAMVARCKEFYEKLSETSARTKVESLINKMLWTDNDTAKEKFNTGKRLAEKNSGKALDAFRDALSYDSGFLAARFEIGMIYYNREQYNDALGYFRTIAEKIPFYGEVNLLTGNIYFSKRYYREAAIYFDRAILYAFLSNKTESNIRMKRATCYYFTGEYDSAIEDLEFVRRYSKNSIKPLLLLSALQIKQEQYDNAIKNLRRAHRIDSKNNEVLFQLGSLYYKTEDEKYVSYFNSLFNRYSQKKPEDTPAKYIKAFKLLAGALYENDQHKNVVSITSWLPEDAMNYDMRLVTAHSYYNLKDYKKAINNFEKISLNTDDTLTLCRAYARAEFPDKAITLLKSLYYNSSVREKAAGDPVLKELMAEIENQEQEVEEPEQLPEKTPDTPEPKLETVDTETIDTGKNTEEKENNGDGNITDNQNEQQPPQ